MSEVTTGQVNVEELEQKVQQMYRDVALEPDGDYHFEMGRGLAEHLGYPPEALDRIPPRAIESFAGVGYYFDLADLQEGESVIDLGSGSGMDAFFAADAVGAEGSVVGIDFTPEQLEKSRALAAENGFAQVEFREGRIDRMPVPDDSFDCAISNGVVNLAPEKAAVFADAARVLRPGGRIALADIVSEHQLKESTVCNADLWAACIGGAAQQDVYRAAIEGAGLEVEEIRENPYRFISDQAINASDKYGVKSVSVRAVKPG